MNILVIGGGGREHAIIYKIKQSPLASKVFAIPGNAGIEQLAECLPEIEVNNHQAIVSFCKKQDIELVVIGPEQPLTSGLADDLRQEGFKVFGPSKKASQLEASKIFTKQICEQYDIPTARYATFNEPEAALNYLQTISYPCVIKADGIASGKGVIIAQNISEAKAAVKEVLGGKFGEAGKNIIIEEFLEGVEVSFFALCSGSEALFLGSAGDHKKVGEGETGLNTGGMGAYSPSPFLSSGLEEEVMQTIIKPTLRAMLDLNSPFCGVLFAGLILTKDGPKLLEFNVRFGDPETQAILLRLESDLLELLLKAEAGKLAECRVKFSSQAALCVVMAAKGYPEDYQKGSIINNLDSASNFSSQAVIFHAGTKRKGQEIVAASGRVLGVTALGKDIKEAKELAYEVIDLISWPEGFCRRDIGFKAL